MLLCLNIRFALPMLDKCTWQTDTEHSTQQNQPEGTVFSNLHRAFSRTDHIGGHKARLKTLRRLKSYQATFPTTLV
jgi:hypothetical protein